MTVRKHLEASNFHVLPSTMQRIEDGELGVHVMSGPYGAFIAVLNSRDLERQLVQEADLYPLLQHARDHDCVWVFLDRDADIIDSLPTYEAEWKNMSMGPL